MSKNHKRGSRQTPPPHARAATQISARRAPDGDVWELVHPRCASERAEDLEEVRKMLDAGEVQIAVDELRWLLEGCPDFIAAHRLLGELALAEDDWKLARGHFGIAYQLGIKATQDIVGTAPYQRASNQDFLESGKGLAWCLTQLNQLDLARQVIERMLTLDPADPLGVSRLLP